MTADQLSAVFGALADPTRRAILTRLTKGEATVAELAAPFRVSQPAIPRHLKVLEQAGLLPGSRRAAGRLSHLRAQPLRAATAWLAGYREYWDQSYDRLDGVLAGLQDEAQDEAQAEAQEGTQDGQHPHRRRARRTADRG